MNGQPYSAGAFMEAAARVFRTRPKQGTGVRLRGIAAGVVVEPDASHDFRHPWWGTPSWNADSQRWEAYFKPGFVNGLDVVVANAEGSHTSLVAEVQVGLPLVWRDVVRSGQLLATESGKILVRPGEGYPAYFDLLGAKLVEGARELGDDRPEDPTRTREVRACDVALAVARIAANQQVTVLNPFTEQATIDIQTVFDNSYLRANAASPRKLQAHAKWASPQDPTAAELLGGVGIQPQTDEILICTVYALSPPDAPADAQPDAGWELFFKHRVFWNLAHAPKNVLPAGAPSPKIRFSLPLAGGIGQPIVDALLAPVNDSLTAVAAYLGAADLKGEFWTI